MNKKMRGYIVTYYNEDEDIAAFKVYTKSKILASLTTKIISQAFKTMSILPRSYKTKVVPEGKDSTTIQ